MTGGLLPDDIETLARRVVEENRALGRKVTVRPKAAPAGSSLPR